MKRKKGQISIGFHWIYILIAGAIILLFFVGLAVRQKVVAEERISATVVRTLEGIFTGAGLSEQTTHYTELPETEISFICDEDGYSDYSIGSIKTETPFQPIFTPERVKSNVLISWTLEWMIPFKADNFLFVTAPNIRYYLVYNEMNRPWALEIEAALPGQLKGYINFVPLEEAEYLSVDNLNDYKVRFVFLGNTFNSLVPSSLVNMADRDVTAVQLDGISGGSVATFFRKSGSSFVQDGSSGSILMGSFSDRNPSLYGAIFADDKARYECNLKKAFKRLKVIGEINLERALKLQGDDADCQGLVRESNFIQLISKAQQCSETISPECDLQPNVAQGIVDDNGNLGSSADCNFFIY